MAETSEKRTRIKNIFVIIAFVLLIIVGIWSAIQAALYIPRLFSSASAPEQGTQELRLGKNDIVMRVSPQNALSGSDVLVEWKRKGDNTGVMSFAYACTEGVYVSVADEKIPCNAPFTMSPDTSELVIVPHTRLDRMSLPVAVTYTNEQNESVRATDTIVVIANTTDTHTSTQQQNGHTNDQQSEDAPTRTSTETDPSSSSSYTSGDTRTPTEAPSVVVPKQSAYAPSYTTQTVRVPRASNPYGVTDLAISAVRVGTVDAYGRFIEQSSVSRYSRGALLITAFNAGTKETGIWHFSATLPLPGGYLFYSQPQQNILPGASVDILVTFDQMQAGSHPITVQIDPYNNIPESNEYNNVQTVYMTVYNF